MRVVVPVPGMLMIPGMYERVLTSQHAARHSIAQYRTVPHGKARQGVARHRTALRC